MRHSWLRWGCSISTVAVALAVPPVFGQTSAGQRSNPDRPMPSEQRRQRQQDLAVQGAVVFDDGSPAPAHVLIKRFCGTGNGIPETYTDSKGRFSFELGKLTGFNPDATQGYAGRTPGHSGEELTSLTGMMDRPFGRGYGEKLLTGCTLRAELPGFRSTAVDLGPRGPFDDPDVGQLVLRPLGDVEGLGLSLVSLRAPEAARESFEKGMKDFEKRKWGNARKHFQKAIDAYPDHAEAWFALGRAFEEDGKLGEARQAFERAATVDGRFVPPRIGLARLEAGEQKWDAVVERTDRILSMNPDNFVEPYFYSAMANFNLERFPVAERRAREALARGAETRFPRVLHLLALSVGYQNQPEEAVIHLKRYLEIAPDEAAAATARQQLEGIQSYLARQRP